jgi:hypothetical protein
MHGTFFDIGLGLGLAAACGLRPFLPLLLVGALSSDGDLDVSFAHGSFHFLQAGWWLLAVAIALVLAYAVQLLAGLSPVADLRSRSAGNALASAIAGLSLGAGAVVCAGALAGHGDVAWPGLVGGLLAAGLAARAASPVILGARSRLADRAAREALSVYLDAASLLVAALVALLHPLGYVVVVALAWFVWRGRARGGERYAGLRVLGD